MRVACVSFSGPGANVGRDGERAAGDVLERWRGERRLGDGEPSLTVNREGVFGNRENAGLFVGCGEVARRGLSCLAFASNSCSFLISLDSYNER